MAQKLRVEDKNMSAVDSKDMALRGRIGGFARAAKYPRDELTSSARRSFMARFEPQDPSLSEEERQRRAQANLRAHMARLARLSAIKRKRQ